MPRFAAETSFQLDRATTAASRVIHALARFVEEGQPTLQHGLERWLVARIVALSRSKPWHTGKGTLLNLPFDPISVP